MAFLSTDTDTDGDSGFLFDDDATLWRAMESGSGGELKIPKIHGCLGGQIQLSRAALLTWG